MTPHVFEAAAISVSGALAAKECGLSDYVLGLNSNPRRPDMSIKRSGQRAMQETSDGAL
jgi:hypothetical protein